MSADQPAADRPSAAATERLAAAQAALVRALVAGGPTPAGFDPTRVAATATALRRKRARQVAKAFPALAQSLGDGFTTRFQAYAAANPPPSAGTLSDGLRFAKTLTRTGELVGEARVERLIAHARLAGGRSRQTVYCRAVLTGEPRSRRLVAVVRAPLLGEHWLTIPLVSGLRRDRHDPRRVLQVLALLPRRRDDRGQP
jgi:hypothetical protein